MGEAIGQSLQMAVGVALSPMPIIAVVLLLTTGAARRNGTAFVLGWLVGLAVIGVVVLAVVGPAAHGQPGHPATWVSWLQLLLGALLLVVAVRQFMGRPAADATPMTPRWMQSIQRFGAAQSAGVGAVLSGLNVKNLLLAVAAATAIAKTGVPGAQQALAYGVFAVIATLGVAAPVVIYLTMGDRSAKLLARLKDWMSRHNAVIMSVLCLVISAKLIGDSVSGLTG
jgi:Kef-type K+ transport system membrane component KefB